MAANKEKSNPRTKKLPLLVVPAAQPQLRAPPPRCIHWGWGSASSSELCLLLLRSPGALIQF